MTVSTDMKELYFFQVVPTEQRSKYVGRIPNGTLIDALDIINMDLCERKLGRFNTLSQDLTEKAIQAEIMANYSHARDSPSNWENWGGPSQIRDEIASLVQLYMHAFKNNPNGQGLFGHRITVKDEEVDRVRGEFQRLGYEEFKVDRTYQRSLEYQQPSAFFTNDVPFKELVELLVPSGSS